MKENLASISFVANGHIVQDIVLSTDDPIEADELVRMLQCGEAYTTVHEDNDVIMSDGSVIGTVRYSDTELEYTDFQVEGGNYDHDAPDPLPPFDLTRIARAGAIGEFIFEPEKSVTEIMQVLTVAGGNEPELVVEEQYSGLSGRQLLKEIDLMERGLKSLMSMAYDAGKLGQEIV